MASLPAPMQEELHSTPSTDALATEVPWSNVSPHATHTPGLQDPYQGSQAPAIIHPTAADDVSYPQMLPMSEGFSPRISSDLSFESEEDGNWSQTALAQACAEALPPLEDLDSDSNSFKAFLEALAASSGSVADLDMSGLRRQGEPVASTSEFGESTCMQ